MCVCVDTRQWSTTEGGDVISQAGHVTAQGVYCDAKVSYLKCHSQEHK